MKDIVPNEVDSMKALDKLEEEGSFLKASAAIGSHVTKLNLPPIERLRNTLEHIGATPEWLAKRIFKLMKAKTYKVHNGKMTKFDNEVVQLKAIEIYMKYYMEANTQNHLHLHGAKIDELLNKTRGDQGEGKT